MARSSVDGPRSRNDRNCATDASKNPESLKVNDAVVGRADLQKKDRSELQTIITALGGSPSSRAKKDDLISMVLDLTGAGAVEPQVENASDSTPVDRPSKGPESNDTSSGSSDGDRASSAGRGGRPARGKGDRRPSSGGGGSSSSAAREEAPKAPSSEDPNRTEPQSDDGNVRTEPLRDDDDDPANRRRRRRGRSRDRDEEPVNVEPQPVGGNLDLRDEGYGFLRVDGALPSPEDVYVPLKTVRIFGLRKGDHVSGTARPAARNERNAALHSLDQINDKDPGIAKNRPRFGRQTPVFPTEALSLEVDGSTTGRVIDLMVPLGKGQRALVVAPPETGATSILADIAASIETNHGDVRLIVMLLADRPEEITEMSRRLDAGEVIASPFDRPPEEQVAVAEMAIERAKRMVEEGDDVVVLVDGLTALVRARNLVAPAGGRLLAGGVDASAIYPAKRFFGAARALEEGGSLTIIAIVESETGSPTDELILEEFRGTATAEIRLSRHLADRGVFPAIDLSASFTRAEDQLFDPDEAALVAKLRDSVASDDPITTMKNLLGRIVETGSNAELLNRIH